MGEHKRNPVAIAAKRGELPPKKPKMSKAQGDRLLYAKCQAIAYKHIGAPFVKLWKGGEG